MKRLASSLFAAFSLLVATLSHAQAAFVFTLTDTPNGVVLDGSGTLNTTGLSFAFSNSSTSQFDAGFAQLYGGPAMDAPGKLYRGGGLTGPTSFGSSINNYTANSGGGDVVGIDERNGFLAVPFNYASGAPLADHSVFVGIHFAEVGFRPGTYVYTWGTGVNADSLTINIVPEPSTWAMLGLGAVGAGVAALRRRRVIA